jgi:hypothetical protein
MGSIIGVNRRDARIPFVLAAVAFAGPKTVVLEHGVSPRYGIGGRLAKANRLHSCAAMRFTGCPQKSAINQPRQDDYHLYNGELKDSELRLN